MSCSHWNEEWVAHLYDELDPSEERLLQQHLEGCSECARRMDELSAARDALREARPEVPATPSVVVLRPRRFSGPLWAYAAGAACAVLVFALGVAAGYRLPGAAAPAAGALPAVAGATAAQGRTAAAPEQLIQARLDPLLQRIDTLEAGLAACNAGPSSGAWLTRQQFDEEMRRMERRSDLKRARDVDFLLGEIGAAEMRTGTYLNRTREALQVVALRSDPQLTER